MAEVEEKEVVETEESVSQQPEAEKAEESASETAAKEGEKPKFYTPEEIDEILSNDGELDRNRLSPEGRLLQRQFERAFTPKLQERAELKKRLDEMEKRIQPQRPNTIEEAYDADPKGTLQYIDSEIAKARTKLKEDPLGAIDQIENLRTVRDNLRDRDLFSTKQRVSVSEVVEEVRADVLEAIPNFQKKVDKLTEYAIDKLGYSLEDVQRLSDPMVVGKAAKNFIMTIDKAYEMENASTTVSKKEVKSVPKTESAGKGESDTPNATYAQALAKAKKTGDWTEVLTMKGTLKRITPET